MYFTIFTLAVLAAVVVPQTSAVAKSPSIPPPSGCSPNYPSTFEVAATSIPMKVKKRQDTLILTLNNGVLMDSEGRTGYIASNYQLQFDNPPQANAIYTAGFSLCSNGSLALGGSALWWKCQSGSFDNLYNSDVAAQCTPALIDLEGATIVATTTTAQEGQPNATVTTLPVSTSSAALNSTTGTSGTVTTTPVFTNSTALISTPATSSTVTKATVSSSSKFTAIAMSLHAGDAMVALAGFAAVALL